MSGEKIVYTLTDVNISGVKGEPDTLVLAMYSGRKDTYFEMKVADLASLAKRLGHTALLLQSSGGRS